jgi:hypothetical protein
MRLSVSQSVSLGVEPHLGPMTRYLLLFDSYSLVFVGRVENTAHHCCSSIVSVGVCLLTKPLRSNGSCIFAYLAVAAQQRIYMLQYFKTSVLRQESGRQTILN